MFLQLVQFAIFFQATFSIDSTYVDNVVRECQEMVKNFASLEMKYAKAPRKRGEPVLFGGLVTPLLKDVNAIERRQRVFECISDSLNKTSDLDLYASDSYRSLVDTCISKSPPIPQCDPSYEYRTINGTCNNLLDPRLASTLGCYKRLFPANYEGVSGIRRSVRRKKRLPSPRSVSLRIMEPGTRLSRDYNSLFIFFGQVVAHDIVEFLFTTVDGDIVLDCCKYARTREQHPQCRPFLLKPNDPFYSKQNISCLDFVRMAPCYSCSLDKRVPLNQVTMFIDASLVYGNIDDWSKHLRRNDGSGKLSSQYVESEELLPSEEEDGRRCQRGIAAKPHYCLISGDTRANQHTVLTMLQTLLLREHNRIAEKMEKLNPHWDEEKLFQESRRILIAEFQVITYNEFLPILLGSNLMSKYELNIGSGTTYDSAIDPSLSVEFNAAAFRIHSLLPGKVVPGEEFEYIRGLYINVSPLYNHRTSAYLSKMANYPAKKFDRLMPVDLTDYLYREKFGTYGFDLAALDVQRGRDVGLPTYSQVIEYMENRQGTIMKFDDLDAYLVPECQKLLRKLYHDVRDIDLWIGLNCERLPDDDDMIMSPTATVIIAEQFRRLKIGDRFYFEHDKTLTDEQRKTLQKASLAKMMCDNLDIHEIQPMAMLFPSNKNQVQFCSDIADVDLQKWKEW